MAVVEACEVVYREVVVLIQRHVETTTDVGVPVTVDVFWSGSPHACCFVVAGAVADAVLCHVDSSPCKDAALMLHLERVVVGIKAVAEGWLQARITLGDVEWVGVVCYVEQVGHAGL